MFKPLRTREELLEKAALLSPTTACARAIQDGNGVVLGGFTLGPDRCYCVYVTAKLGQKWIVGIKVDEISRQYKVAEFPFDQCKVTWVNWNGYLGGTRPLIDGDQHKKEWQELYAKRAT